MLAPLIGVDGQIHYVNPSLIRHMNEGVTLEEKGPDGNPWPTSWVIFDYEDTIHAKGTPAMILSSWFGPPQESKIVVPRIVGR